MAIACGVSLCDLGLSSETEVEHAVAAWCAGLTLLQSWIGRRDDTTAEMGAVLLK